MGEKTSQAKLNTNREYMKKLDDIKLRVPKGYRQKIKDYCEKVRGSSMNQIIIDLLKALGTANLSKNNKSGEVITRTGVGKDVIKLPDDFLEHFDDSNDEIAKLFYGD